MQDTLKIGAAALGAYALGRTKKAKAAISLALWLSGRGRPRDIARNQAVKLLKSERGQDLIGQVRGPVLSAGRTAVLSMFESQAERLTDTLSRRADKMGEALEETGNRAARAGTSTAERLSPRRRRLAAAEEEPEEEQMDEEPAEDEEYEDEYEAEGEYEDEAEPVEDGEERDEYEEEEEEEEEPEEAEEEPAPSGRARSRGSATSGRRSSARGRSRRSVPA